MKIIRITPNASGAYGQIQNGDFQALPEGYALWPDGLDTAEYYAYKGFVTLAVGEVEGVPTVTGYTANAEGFEAWEAAHPSPEPEEPEQPGTDNSALEARVAALEEAVQAGLTLYEEDLGSNG